MCVCVGGANPCVCVCVWEVLTLFADVSQFWAMFSHVLANFGRAWPILADFSRF